MLSAPYFHNEQAAYDFVEARIWPRFTVKIGTIFEASGRLPSNTR